MYLEFIYSALKTINCSYEDRLSQAGLIKCIMGLSQIVRQEGILELEKFAANPFVPPLLKKGLDLLTYDNNTERTVEILIYLVCAGKYENAELLEKLIIIDGVRMISENFNPYVIRERLTALLGEKAAIQLFNTSLKSIWVDSVYGVSTVWWPIDGAPGKKERKLLELLYDTSDQTDRAILNKLEYYDLLLFLHISEKNISRKFMNAMNSDLRTKVMNELMTFKPEIKPAYINSLIRTIINIAMQNRIF